MSKNKEVVDLMKKLENHLNTFLTEKDFNTQKIIGDVEKGKILIEELSNKLAPVWSNY